MEASEISTTIKILNDPGIFQKITQFSVKVLILKGLNVSSYRVRDEWLIMSLSSSTIAVCTFEILIGVIFVLVLLACIVVPFVWCHVCNKSEARNVVLQPMAPQALQPNIYPQYIPPAFHQNTGSDQNLSKSQIIYFLSKTKLISRYQ